MSVPWPRRVVVWTLGDQDEGAAQEHHTPEHRHHDVDLRVIFCELPRLQGERAARPERHAPLREPGPRHRAKVQTTTRSTPPGPVSSPPG